MSQPAITIIVPCHNSERYLRETLASIEQQTLGMDLFQIILVDDASSDSTWEIISDFEQKHTDQVVAIPLEENVKQGAARNIALPYVEGKYLQFLDSDDYLDLTACENLYLLAEELNLDLIEFPYDQFFDHDHSPVPGSTKFEDSFYDLTNNIDGHKALLISEIFRYGHSDKLYRSSMVAQSGATFAEGMTIYEEPKFVYPQLLLMQRAATISKPLYHYRRNAFSSTCNIQASPFNALLHHPEAQFQLLRFLKEHLGELYEIYRDEILYYYLWTFYVETLVFSYQEQRPLPLEQYDWMRRVFLQDIPDASLSIHIQESPFLKDCVDCMKQNQIQTQEDLETWKATIMQRYRHPNQP